MGEHAKIKSQWPRKWGQQDCGLRKPFSVRQMQKKGEVCWGFSKNHTEGTYRAKVDSAGAIEQVMFLFCFV